MKILASLICTAILLVSACASSPQEKAGTQTQVPSTSFVHNYPCEGGVTIAVTYPSNDLATVEYKDSTYTMRIAVSASGSRYVGGGLEWWTKESGSGSEGILLRHKADGTSGEIIARCTKP